MIVRVVPWAVMLAAAGLAALIVYKLVAGA